ncbi:MAG: hypothetical protein JO314_05865 [Acidobacteria bacterium]|nr:hypothetical protein [Acidobacteriota bacterium]
MSEYPRLVTTRHTGNELFQGDGAQPGMSVLSFWRWAASDLVSNTMRGVLAEYIVASALGIADGTRSEWDAYDLKSPEGTRIEVKSASYIQSWRHANLSKIIFGIRPTRRWDADTNLLSADLRRQADVYVFCVLAHQEQRTLNPLNLDQWDFYVLPSGVLDAALPTQKSIGLSSLLKLGPTHTKYCGLAAAIRR